MVLALSVTMIKIKDKSEKKSERQGVSFSLNIM